MGGSQSTKQLPEILHFSNVLGSPIRGVEDMIPISDRDCCFCCSKRLGSNGKNCCSCGEVICLECVYVFDVQPDNKPIRKGVRVCGNCIYQKRIIKCNKCNDTLEAKEYLQHEKSICEYRPVQCMNCTGTYKAKDEAQHLTSCPNRMVACSEGCGENINYQRIEQHLNQECSLRKACPNGCNELIVESRILSHSQRCICRPINCLECHNVVKTNKLSDHLNNECPERIVICTLSCGVASLKFKNLNSHLEQSCPNRLMTCYDNCGLQVHLNRMTEHLTNECSKRVDCRYGCLQKVSRSLSKKHNVTCVCRPTVCANCSAATFLHKIQDHNERECSERLVLCPLRCGERVKAKEEQYHLARICIYRKVLCEEGCGESIICSEMKVHLRTTCPKKVPCHFGCGDAIVSSLFNIEHALVCVNRPSICSDCKRTVKLNELARHLSNACLERTVQCPQKCEERNIKAKLLPDHMFSVCLNRWISCTDGCGFQMMFCQLTRHSTNSCIARVKCDFECGEMIVPSLKAKHLEICPAKKVHCPKCLVVVQFKQLEDHKRSWCVERIIPCSLNCGKGNLKAIDETKHLLQDCKNRNVPCIELCGEMIPYCEMENHLKASCKSLIRCRFSCGSLLRSSQVVQHESKECPRRKVSCSFCTNLVPSENLPHHQLICDSRDVFCTLDCGQKIPKKSMGFHLKQCKNRTVDCPEGCGSKIKHCNIDDHVEHSCSNARTLCVTCGEYVKNFQMSLHDREECGRCCPQKHRLTLLLREQGYTCDRCRVGFQRGYVMCCVRDDFDLCPSCYPNTSVKCVYNCSAALTYRTINEHLKACPNTPLSCFFCKQSFNRASLTSHQRTCSSRSSKIQCAQQTMSRFLRSVMEISDRCSVVSFSDKYEPLSILDNENSALRALQYCANNCSGGTHLWDSITTAVIQFITTANGSCPWVLIILTDGDDQGSRSSITDAANALATFNKLSSNFTFIIGLGTDVNEARLQQLCSASGSQYLKAEDSEILDTLFVLIALKIVNVTQVDVGSIGIDAAYARVRKARQLARASVEFLLLVDTSTSMNSK